MFPKVFSLCAGLSIFSERWSFFLKIKAVIPSFFWTLTPHWKAPFRLGLFISSYQPINYKSAAKHFTTNKEVKESSHNKSILVLSFADETSALRYISTMVVRCGLIVLNFFIWRHCDVVFILCCNLSVRAWSLVTSVKTFTREHFLFLFLYPWLPLLRTNRYTQIPKWHMS